MAWDRFEIRGEDERELVLFFDDLDSYHSPSCWTPDPVIVYDSDEVRVTARYRKTAGFCTLEGAFGSQMVVSLAEPVGDRAVVDGASMP